MDFENLRGHCPNCNHGSAFQQSHHIRIWPSIHFYRTKGSQGYTAPPSAPSWIDLLILRCLHCTRTVTWREQWIAMPSEIPAEMPTAKMIHREMIYPHQSPRELHETVPDGIRSLYAEASKGEQAGAMRAAGVMYRAAVEELVKDQGATGRNLKDKINDLTTKGLDPDLVDDLHEARLLGNDSIHAGITYTAEEVADVADLIEDATVTLYVQPAERKAMRESRANRRDAAKTKKN